MATVANNDLVDGLSGRLGASLVFRTMRGKTFVTTPARKPDKRKESTAQKDTRTTFRQATQWAQHILLNPEKKTYYTKRAKALKLPNAYTAALTDYMRKPSVKTFTHHDKSITCRVFKKDFILKEVTIAPRNTIGTVTPKPIITKDRLCDFTFKLSEAEWRNGIEIMVIDVADRVVVLKMG